MTETVVQLNRGVRAERIHYINKGALIGFVNIHIPAWNLTLKNCGWFQKDGREWIGLPTAQYTRKDGKTSHLTLVEFTDETALKRFQNAALEATKLLAKSANHSDGQPTTHAEPGQIRQRTQRATDFS
jgi:hypothetical protein